jgi:hypothetical protein
MRIWHREIGNTEITEQDEKYYKPDDIEIFWEGSKVNCVYVVVRRSHCEEEDKFGLEGPHFNGEVVDGRHNLFFEVVLGKVIVIPVTKLARRLYKNKIMGEDEKWMVVKS